MILTNWPTEKIYSMMDPIHKDRLRRRVIIAEINNKDMVEFFQDVLEDFEIN